MKYLHLLCKTSLLFPTHISRRTVIAPGGGRVLQPLLHPFVHRHLLDEDTFTENFRNDDWPSRTYLCYKVEGPDQGSGVPLGQDKGILHNKVTRPPSPGTFRIEASGWTGAGLTNVSPSVPTAATPWPESGGDCFCCRCWLGATRQRAVTVSQAWHSQSLSPQGPGSASPLPLCL